MVPELHRERVFCEPSAEGLPEVLPGMQDDVLCTDNDPFHDLSKDLTETSKITSENNWNLYHFKIAAYDDGHAVIELTTKNQTIWSENCYSFFLQVF